jgi:RimJ/RimL family protein N-acetyltransferase
MSETALPKNLLIREAVLEDAEALQQYATALFAEALPTLLQPPQIPTVDEEREFLARCQMAPTCVVLVAETGNGLVGMLDFHAYRHPQRQHAGIFGMSVGRPWRGRGIGTALLDALFQWASRHDLHRIELEVLANNPGAIRLYERRGFQPEGRRRGAVVVEGEPVDLLLMARLVDW